LDEFCVYGGVSVWVTLGNVYIVVYLGLRPCVAKTCPDMSSVSADSSFIR